ncbi:MAG: hypothetical protein ACI8XO_004430 [Verrucomicrobiales bacterium]|jgi:hypothetical protein
MIGGAIAEGAIAGSGVPTYREIRFLSRRKGRISENQQYLAREGHNCYASTPPTTLPATSVNR